MLSEALLSMNPILNRFNPEMVFSSVLSFVGSGYTGLVIAVVIILGIVKKMTKVLKVATIGLVVWFLITSGTFNMI